MRQVAPTRSQKIMLFFMSMILAGLIGFTIVEVRGILSPLPEDTFSEWVFDLPTWAILVIDVPFVAVAVIAGWASIHFLVDRNAAWRGEYTDRFMGGGHRTPAKVIRPIVELLEDWYFPPQMVRDVTRGWGTAEVFNMPPTHEETADAEHD